ncbi:metal dependent phosphohydrolase [Ectothiorhodospira sp. PHS-1]|nr:metal dependent phosphohydrolase [Ectothiorhodospira sp. PHS-1]
MQGLLIRSPAQIRELAGYCAHVYIDFEKSAGHRPQALSQPQGADHARRLAQGIDHRNPRDVPLPHTLQEVRELVQKAKSLRDEAHRYILDTIEDIRLGSAVDTEDARQLVGAMVEQVIESPNALVWLTQLRDRDEYTSQHSINVCILALTFGRFLGMRERHLQTLGLGALLHDIGKMKVPLEILNAPRRLSEAEFQVMKAHPELGHLLLRRDRSLPREALNVVIGHHERMDGGGYPHGLQGEAIPLYARLVAVVDVYDAVSSNRVYHARRLPQEALAILFKMRGKELDTALVESFIRCIGVYPVGSLVELKSGEVGVVVGFNNEHRLKPTLMLLLDAGGAPLDQPVMMNLASPAWADGGNSPAIGRIRTPDEVGLDPEKVIHALQAQQGSQPSG